MHNPLWVAAVGALGLLVNAICFFTIGGYTFHQTSFLDSHPGEDVVISESVQVYVRDGMKNRRRQSLIAIFRDCFGAVLVVVCATMVYYFGDPEKSVQPSDYVDPILTICTVLILGCLSYRLAKEAGHILLLTIPDHINVKSLVAEMKTNFPELYDIHDLHVWQLTPARIIASAHIVLQQTQGYIATKNNIVDFFHSKGISHITIQPEFLHLFPSDGTPTCTRRRKCFLPCEEDDCEEKQCCGTSSLTPCSSHQPINSARNSTSLDPGPSTSGAIRLATISSSPEDENTMEPEIPELEPMIP
jgi:Co/Zn/Cd efflux system component